MPLPSPFSAVPAFAVAGVTLAPPYSPNAATATPLAGTVSAALRRSGARVSLVWHADHALPAGTAGRFPIKFYLTAMLFIVFDIEIVFLYPWAQSAVALGVLGLVEIILFIVTVAVVYTYAWRRGGLDWD